MSEVDKATFREICSLPRFKDAITLIAVTKLNWWQTNHHVGQLMKEPQGYAKKVWLSNFLTQNLQGNFASHTMHTIGHWCCTINILGGGFAHIPGIRDAGQSTSYPICYFGPSEDAKKRLDSFPAGTHKIVIIRTAFHQFENKPYMKYIPA